MTEQNVTDVYNLVEKYKVGIPIDTEGRAEKDVLNEIIKYLKC